MDQLNDFINKLTNGDEQAQEQYAQLKQAAKYDPKAKSILEQVNQALGIQMNRKGAKLEYISRLRGKCPDGYELGYFETGGVVCSKCMKKAEEGAKMKNSSDNTPEYITKFKNARKEKCGGKVKKAVDGTKTDEEVGVKRTTKNGVTKTVATGVDDYDGNSKGITYSDGKESGSAYIADRFAARKDTSWYEGSQSTKLQAEENRKKFYKLQKKHEQK